MLRRFVVGVFVVGWSGAISVENQFPTIPHDSPIIPQAIPQYVNFLIFFQVQRISVGNWGNGEIIWLSHKSQNSVVTV